jgi:hypothetical protein
VAGREKPLESGNPREQRVSRGEKPRGIDEFSEGAKPGSRPSRPSKEQSAQHDANGKRATALAHRKLRKSAALVPPAIAARNDLRGKSFEG